MTEILTSVATALLATLVAAWWLAILLGLVFPSSRTGEVAAQLSGPVEVIFEGDRTYVLRVQGHLVHLSKEKVLGSVR